MAFTTFYRDICQRIIRESDYKLGNTSVIVTMAKEHTKKVTAFCFPSPRKKLTDFSERSFTLNHNKAKK